MSKYKVTYLNTRGMGENIRYILSYAGVPFEDIRVEWKDFQENLKKDITEYEWGQLPILEFDGQILTQSCAILRYLAKQYGLIAKDDLEAARCDEYVDCMWDFLRKYWIPFATEQDVEKRAKLKDDLLKIHLPNFLSKVNSFVKRHGGKWLVGNQLTWGDLFYANYLEIFEDYTDSDILTPFPELKSLRDQVWMLPKIKEWRKKRPVEPRMRNRETD